MLDLTTLPSSCKVGSGVRIVADEVRIGEDVRLDDGVTIVGGSVTIGAGTRIGRGADLRADRIAIGPGSEVAGDVGVLVAERFEVGAAARVSAGCRVLCRSFTAGNLLYLGDGASVGFGGTTSSTAHVRIGSRVTIGQFSILNANHPIEIGDNVGTGSYLAIWTHGYHFGHGPLNGSRPAYAPVTVGRNVWLGFQVTILPGVTIGEDSMIAAGAVVSGPIPPGVLAGGVPARVRKTIDVSPVPDAVAFDSVADVLGTWRAELGWKGCHAEPVETTPDRIVVRVSTGTDRVLVVLARGPATADRPVPADRPEPVVLLNVGGEAYQGPVDQDVTVFDLRAGQLRGRRSPLVEDLRDQLRRNAMPCGDDTTFSSIEPEPFARLRRACGPTPAPAPAAGPGREL